MSTTLRLGVQMIESLEGIHKLGYVHRDVKPSNFVIGRSKRTSIYLIDFGLARKHKLPNGNIRSPRKIAGFRGTARYASLNSHKMKELGRRDDLWSVFYSLIEFALGSLPWKRIREKEFIAKMKERITKAELLGNLPKEFEYFMDHLNSLNYEDEPNYNYLKGLLITIYTREGYSMEEPFDWMVNEQIFAPQSREISSILDEPISLPMHALATKAMDSITTSCQRQGSLVKGNSLQSYSADKSPKIPATNNFPFTRYEAVKVEDNIGSIKSKCICCIM
jgi:serine/threonine protein kinase